MRTFLYPIEGTDMGWKVVDRNPKGTGMGHGVAVERDDLLVALVPIQEKRTIQRDADLQLTEYEEVRDDYACSCNGIVIETHLLDDFIDALENLKEDLARG